MKIAIKELASVDIAEGYEFYEEQSLGLGSYFEASILAEINSLSIYAGVHEIHYKIYHRKVADKFPYAIYYTVEDDVITIHAVSDTRRDPAKIRYRFH